MEQLHRDEWLIGLSSWVVQDGNYVDFAVGEHRRFAVGSFGDDLHEGTPGHKHARAHGEGRYDVSGDVIVADHGLVVLDFGLLAYTDSRAPSAGRGEWLAGRVSLEVDCYSYFEIHAKKRGVPRAVYAWTITGIWRQMAPLIPDAAKGPKWLKRDPDRLGWGGWIGRMRGQTTTGLRSTCFAAGSSLTCQCDIRRVRAAEFAAAGAERLYPRFREPLLEPLSVLSHASHVSLGCTPCTRLRRMRRFTENPVCGTTQTTICGFRDRMAHQMLWFSPDRTCPRALIGAPIT